MVIMYWSSDVCSADLTKRSREIDRFRLITGLSFDTQLRKEHHGCICQRIGTAFLNQAQLTDLRIIRSCQLLARFQGKCLCWSVTLSIYGQGCQQKTAE